MDIDPTQMTDDELLAWLRAIAHELTARKNGGARTNDGNGSFGPPTGGGGGPPPGGHP